MFLFVLKMTTLLWNLYDVQEGLSYKKQKPEKLISRYFPNLSWNWRFYLLWLLCQLQPVFIAVLLCCLWEFLFPAVREMTHWCLVHFLCTFPLSVLLVLVLVGKLCIFVAKLFALAQCSRVFCICFYFVSRFMNSTFFKTHKKCF